MKILTYQSDDFWRQLEEHLFIRDEETSSKIEADVKSIIKSVSFDIMLVDAICKTLKVLLEGKIRLSKPFFPIYV